MPSSSTGHRQTGLLLALFVLSAVTTAWAVIPALRTADTVEQKMAYMPVVTVPTVLGEKIEPTVAYLKMTGFQGPVNTQKRTGEFALTEMRWLTDIKKQAQRVQVSLPMDVNAPGVLAKLASKQLIKLVTIARPQDDGSIVVWKLSDVSVLSYQMTANGDNVLPVENIIFESSKITKSVAFSDADSPTDCATVVSRLVCEQTENCVWFEPKNAGNQKNLVELKGFCQTYTPPPVTTTTPRDPPPDVNRVTDPKDPTAVTKVPTGEQPISGTQLTNPTNTSQPSTSENTNTTVPATTHPDASSGSSSGGTSAGTSGGTSGSSSSGGTSGGTPTN